MIVLELIFIISSVVAYPAHLAHKIHWDMLADYVTPLSNCGIILPVGECGRIHASRRQHQIQVERRNYITDDMICLDPDCKEVGERYFQKKNKKGEPFGEGLKKKDDKLSMFLQNLHKVILEFARTELESPVRTSSAVEREDADKEAPQSSQDLTLCDRCNKFFEYLEFGDKAKLFEYSKPELQAIFACSHGGQAVGNSTQFLLFHIFHFYVYSNVIVYLDLTTEDKRPQWPKFMRPGSFYRWSLEHACDGQTFLPNSRKYLKNAMIDLDETAELSKRLFRFMYFFVMMKIRLDSSYELQEDFQLSHFECL